MIELKNNEVWFVTGSQDLYGKETLDTVAEHSKAMVQGLAKSPSLPVTLVGKPVVKNPQAIAELCREADSSPRCIGIIAWMHTFSPAKMWIQGLTGLKKPLLHLHTQYNRDIPWSTIDMDFMNCNQSAHGDREFGFIGARLRLTREVVVGFWQDAEVQARIGIWTRAASARHDAQGMRIARFGDNMREVAVTEGDKVEAQIRFGYSVNGYGMGDLAGYVSHVTDAAVDRLASEYDSRYAVAQELRAGGKSRHALREAAKIELGMRSFLVDGGFSAFTTTFENLHGLVQLPGIAVQRLMADGYGFGAEGDWKTAALLRAMKVMGSGLPGGCSFMEDYTYHFGGKSPKVLGAHMLEVCESIAAAKPSAEIHPLGIGGKADPVRLVFTAKSGPAVNASIIDLGDRFRMIVNEVVVEEPAEPLPKLPVARAVWTPRPDLPTAAAAWILAGGAHHTGYSQAVTADHLSSFAEMSGIEILRIDGGTSLSSFKKELMWNSAYYRLAKGL
jgi:L-arabinose isomerase